MEPKSRAASSKLHGSASERESNQCIDACHVTDSQSVLVLLYSKPYSFRYQISKPRPVQYNCTVQRGESARTVDLQGLERSSRASVRFLCQGERPDKRTTQQSNVTSRLCK